jgi:hypothetical protein
VSRSEKILALQFKYFGDAVLMTPALRALRERFPQAEIHLLVPAETAPLFQHLPWLTRVWAMPRQRGRASLRETWPLISALRRERFDRSVDFASNDRGAILSFLIGATRRLGWDERGGFFGRRFFYNDRVASGKNPPHESARLAQLLASWQIPAPASLAPEIRADAALADAARKILPAEKRMAADALGEILSTCHRRRLPVGVHHRARGAGGRADKRVKKTDSRRGDFAADCRAAVVSRRAGAGENFHFRRHRPAPFRRRTGCANDFIVWPDFARALGTHWQKASRAHRRQLRLRR